MSPGVGVDIDGMTMLGEAIDEGAQAGGVVEDGPPLLVGEVCGQDDSPSLVPAADDMKEQIGGAAVAGYITELVEDQEVRRGIAA